MSNDQLPAIEALPSELTAVEAFRRLANLPHVVFFDSAQLHEKVGRYSFVAADPFEWIEAPNDPGDALGRLERRWSAFSQTNRADLPPFQGGAAALLSYELCRSLEAIPSARWTDLPTPTLAAGLYDVVLAFDHQAGQGWLISQGFPEVEPSRRRRRAESRLAKFRRQIDQNEAPRSVAPEGPAIPAGQLAPQRNVGLDPVTSNFSAESYRSMIRRGIEYIRAGDLFQVNLAQRLVCPAESDSRALYLRLREQNPAPYAGYFDLGSFQICSASPECFLTLRGRRVETRPIKGTRGRSTHVEADLFSGDELLGSEKDRAENVMIVDLLRNDLSRVCSADSVHVERLCELETYAFVKHLVSVVRGELAADRTPFDLLRATFPGGSITGAPKVRAMEVIAELEPTVRGPYCGSLAYIGFDGQMDASILIRTVTAAHGWWQLPVGGGIVAQSDPEAEYQETWHKARGLLAAIL